MSEYPAPPHPNGVYKNLFFILLAFVLGNAVSFVVFGVHTVNNEDFNRATSAITARQDAQDAHMQSIDTRIANLSGQLTGKHLLSNP